MTRDREAGFTLMEALATVAIIAAILSAIGTVAGQWLPHWRHGFEALQNADIVAQSLDRAVADLSTAEYVRLDPATAPPLFRGDADSVMFVRAASGPGATPRLEYVRIGVNTTKTGMEAQRSHADCAPGAIGPFRDAATLLHAPFRLTFAYQGMDGRWNNAWSGAATLPRSMRLTIKNGARLVASTVFQLKTTSGPSLAPPEAAKTDEPPATAPGDVPPKTQ